MIRCGSCGEENPPRARFCLGCAAPLASRDAWRETRRIVTVLFADLVGSTAIGERLDPETFRSIQTRYFAALRGAIESHGGTVEKYIGDAVMAVFGLPTLHEDDALRAVRAAVAFAPALEALNAELTARHGVSLQIRVGLHTGEVVAGDASARQAMVSGDTVNTAARLEAAARPGEILLGPLTFELVRDAIVADALHDLALRGRDEALTAYRLLAVTGTEAHLRRLDTPLVGRTEELAVLRAAFDRAVREHGCEMVTLLAPAGTGKSRLVREFLSTIQDGATIIRGRCLSYGDGITYWALAEILRAAAMTDESDDPATARAKLDDLVAADADPARVAGILASVLGLARETATADDIAWAVRRTLALIADQGPLVVLVEDIHWAEPALLDLLESVVDRSARTPILLLCPARQELLASRADWARERSNAIVLQLEPLDAERASDLIDLLPGGRALPSQLRGRILEASEGNPLFVEEFLAMLVDEGHLRPASDGGWSVATILKDVAVPRSISLLLAARLDSLDAGDRRVAQRGSVVGRVFERAAVEELSPQDERGSLGGRLLSLTRRQVIRPDSPGLDGDDAFRFRHVLIRDAAYDALTKADRADLHERCGRWLVDVVGERFAEYVEIIAHHFAQAAEYRLGLSTLEERPGLAREAVAMLLSAADRSEQVNAHLEAVRLLRRALQLMPAEDDAQRASRVQVLERAAEDARVAQEPDAAWDLGSQALAEVPADTDPATMARLHTNAGVYARDVGDDAGRDRHLEEARNFVAACDDPNERASVLARLGRITMMTGRLSESEAMCREVVATSGVDDVTLASASITLASDLYWQQRFDEMEAQFAQGRLYAETADSGIELLRWYNNYAIAVEELQGPDAAAKLCAEGLAASRRYGLERTSYGVALALNTVSGATERGRARDVEATVRDYLDAGLSGREAVWAGTMLGHALMHQGRLGEANDVFLMTRRLAQRWPSSDDLGDLAETQATLALWLGDPDASLAFAEESIAALEHSQAWLIVRAIAVGLRALGDRIERLRTVGDEAAMAAVVEQAATWRERARVVEVGGGDDLVFGKRGQACSALVEAEWTRIIGEHDPGAWSVAVTRERSVYWRAHAAYAGWQAARALCRTGAHADTVRDAIHDALTDGDASEPARVALVALAAQQGIDVNHVAAGSPDWQSAPSGRTRSPP